MGDVYVSNPWEKSKWPDKIVLTELIPIQVPGKTFSPVAGIEVYLFLK